MLNSALHYLWVFLNSQFGIAVVSGLFISLLTTAVTWVATKSARLASLLGWLYESHKGALFDAVREAEKAIPDDTQNKGLQRLDTALKYVIKIAPELAKQKPEVVKALINKAHAEAEAKDMESGA